MTPQDIMKNLNAKIGNSKYFTWAEALWLPKVQAFAMPTEAQAATIIRLAEALDKVREYFGAAIIIHSWLRPVEYNKLVKGARQSMHLTGGAVDFHIEGVAVSYAQETLEKNKQLWPYRGERATPTWLHLDLGNGGWFFP